MRNEQKKLHPHRKKGLKRPTLRDLKQSRTPLMVTAIDWLRVFDLYTQAAAMAMAMARVRLDRAEPLSWNCDIIAGVRLCAPPPSLRSFHLVIQPL